MSTEAGRFVVLLTQAELPDPVVLAKSLAAARQTPLQDQMIPARAAWGIVAENLSEAEAKTLAAQLQPVLPCRVLAETSMATLPAATPLTQWEPSLNEGCLIIAAAAITISSTITRTIKEGPSATQRILSTGIMLATGLPIKLGPKKRTIEKKQETSDLFFYLDLVYKNPPRRRRIDAQKFDYSALKERKLYNLLGNFKLILGDLANAAPEAARTQGTRIFLENKPLQTMKYATLTDLERETRWLLTRRSLQESPSE